MEFVELPKYLLNKETLEILPITIVRTDRHWWVTSDNLYLPKGIQCKEYRYYNTKVDAVVAGEAMLQKEFTRRQKDWHNCRRKIRNFRKDNRDIHPIFNKSNKELSYEI